MQVARESKRPRPSSLQPPLLVPSACCQRGAWQFSLRLSRSWPWSLVSTAGSVKALSLIGALAAQLLLEVRCFTDVPATEACSKGVDSDVRGHLRGDGGGTGIEALTNKHGEGVAHFVQHLHSLGSA